MTGFWIGVAAAEHVRRGLAEGFMQVSHGKIAPLRRIKPGDRVVYYSPSLVFSGKDKLQAFTAIGLVRDGEPYQSDMGNGFCPYRRDVAWLAAQDAPIKPLLPSLEFSAGRSNWGYAFRFGLVAIGEPDFNRIAIAMQVDLSAHATLTRA